MGSARNISDYADFAERVRPQIESALADSLPIMSAPTYVVFNQALHDAVFPGGKRVRPTLSLMASDVVCASSVHAMAAAVAVEYLHCSALVFDDLPAIDNARERRGRACLHLCYGEGTAIMAALALLNSAYDVITRRLWGRGACNPAALREVVDSIAVLICGQVAELAPQLRAASHFTDSQSLRHGKTSALFRLSLTLGLLLSAVDADDVATLAHAGELFGLAYQILDDCRDIEEDSLLIHRGRSATFAMQAGRTTATSRVFNLVEQAEHELAASFGTTAAVTRLCSFMNSICS
jgi:geranylgeranyl pyrophosphate synthase